MADKTSTSKVLAGKRVEDILNPKPVFVTIGEQEYQVLPMPDSSLMHIGDAIRDIAGILHGVASLDEVETLSAEEMMPLIPQILQILMPHASAIISASLGVEEDFIQRKLTLAGRVRMLNLILEVEDIPALVAAFDLLTATFKTVFPTPPAKKGDDEEQKPNPATD